jgi:predicted transcriptional regulator
MSVSDTSVSIRLTEEQTRVLDEIGKRDDRSRSWLIRRAVDEYIERHADST